MKEKKSNCNLLFMSAQTNYLGTEVGILNTFTIHALVPDEWMRLFFEPCARVCVQLPPPLKPNQRERRLCRAAVNVVFLCTFAYFFCFTLTPENVTC